MSARVRILGGLVVIAAAAWAVAGG
ncbi:MAG: hypothetical protein JWO38_3338, partial [Gemmataceae bacterium]|nr:hypothetical protein [Gemmataceae bacterium]